MNNSIEMKTEKSSQDGWLFDNRIVEICTLVELAERLKISVSGLRKVIARDAKFPRIKVGQQLRFNWLSVESYLSNKGK